MRILRAYDKSCREIDPARDKQNPPAQSAASPPADRRQDRDTRAPKRSPAVRHRQSAAREIHRRLLCRCGAPRAWRRFFQPCRDLGSPRLNTAMNARPLILTGKAGHVRKFRRGFLDLIEIGAEQRGGVPRPRGKRDAIGLRQVNGDFLIAVG